MMKMISPILMILCGVLAALGIWFPRLRAHWKGTRIPCGPLSCSGFALLFIGGGVVFLVIDSISEGDRIYFGFPAIVGFILAARLRLRREEVVHMESRGFGFLLFSEFYFFSCFYGLLSFTNDVLLAS